jgi:hypothetical protein
MIMQQAKGHGSIMGYLDRANDAQLIHDVQEIQNGGDNDLKQAIGRDSQEAQTSFNDCCSSMGLM